VGYRPEYRFVAFPLSWFVLEFLAGAAIAWLAIPWTGRAALALCLLAIAWVAAGSFAFFDPDSSYLLLAIGPRVWVFAPPCVLVVFALSGWERTGGRIGSRILVLLGDASYSIYLIHLAALAGTFYLTMLVNWSHSRTGHVAWIIVMLASAIGAGLIFHGCVERPLMKLAKTCRLPPIHQPCWVRRILGDRFTSSLSPAPRNP